MARLWNDDSRNRRPVGADEIVVVIDSTAGESEAGEYAAVADRVLRYDRGPNHSGLAWLHAQCAGDWVLLLAGDEVCSPELVAALPELTRSRTALQYAFSMRWLWPGPDQWLCGAPWHPDFHIRLVRNDGTLRFLGRAHELAIPAWPHRYLDVPLWHLSLLGTDEEQRHAKVVANRAEQGGLIAAGGDELNHAYYLPEDRGAVALEAVPAADRAQIAAVLQASPRPAADRAGLPVAGRPEIDPLWAGRAVSKGAFRATVVPLSEDILVMYPGETRSLFVRVRNDGDERWPWGLDHPPYFRVGYRWARGGRLDVSEPEGRGVFTCEVCPGEECIVPVPVTAPMTSGRWALEFDVLLEHVRWFGAPCSVVVKVT